MRLALFLCLLSCASPPKRCLPPNAPNGYDVTDCLMAMEHGDEVLGCLAQGVTNRDNWIAAAIAACGVKQ